LHASERETVPQRLRPFCELLLLLLVLAGTVRSLQHAAALLPQPFSLNFEEGNQLDAALAVARGRPLYPPVGNPPYIVHPYGPVFYLVHGLAVRLSGPSFVPGRVLVLGAGLAVALLLIAWLRRATASWSIALGFGLTFLSVSLVRTWLPLLRVDLPGLLLALVGLYLVATCRRPVLAALCFLAALFTKPTFVAAPLASLFYLALARRWAMARRLAATLVLGGLSGLALLAALTRGWALFHMFLAFPDPYSLHLYATRIAPFFVRNLPLVAGTVLLAVTAFRRRHPSLPLLYAALATVMTLTAGKWGSDANHFLEWQAALALAAGIGYAEFCSHPGTESAVALIPLTMAIIIGFGLSNPAGLSPLLRDCREAYRLAQQTPGEVLSENPGAAVLSGKTVWLSNAFEFRSLSAAGRLNPQPLIGMVEGRFFSLILLQEDLPTLAQQVSQPPTENTIWSREFVQALGQNYRQVRTFSCAGANDAFVPLASAANNRTTSLGVDDGATAHR